MPDFPDYIVRQMLQDAGNDWDFELFCTRHYTEIEGINYLPTSRSYDLGADGRAIHKRRHGESYIIASMQKIDLERKAVRDLRKLLDRVAYRPAKIRICFAFLKTEQERRQIENAARRINPAIDFEVTGIVQLVEEVGRHPTPFEQTYEAALSEVHRQRESVDRSSQSSIRLGLRVLLATQLDQEAQHLRHAMLSGLVLQATKRNGSTPQIEVIRSVTEAVGLHRQIPLSYIAEVFNTMERTGYISIDQFGNIARRELASDAMVKTGDDAARRALEGFGALRRSLSHHFDESLTATDFRRIWRAIQQQLIRLFQRYGTEFVEFIHTLGDSHGCAFNAIPESPFDGLHKVAQSVDALELSLSRNKVDRLIRILPDAMLDVPSGARRWLSQLCLAYVCACSLGLHPDALKRIEVRLRSWDVMPDTHLLLSALGRGETDRAQTIQLMRWWLDAGGRLLAIDPFVRETRRHAELAAQMIKRWAAKCQRRRGRPRVRNAPPDGNVFLRSAIAACGKDLGPAAAERHIRQFQGSGPDDTEPLLNILEADFGLQRGPTLSLNASLVERVYRVIAATRLRDDYDYEDQAANARSRCRHDAEALAYLASYRVSLRGTNRVAIILSHSSHLRNVHDRFHSDLGFMPPCIDPARLLFAMSLVPGAAFTMSSLESALFGTAFQMEVKRNEGLAMKVMDKLARRDHNGDYTPALTEIADRNLTVNQPAASTWSCSIATATNPPLRSKEQESNARSTRSKPAKR